MMKLSGPRRTIITVILVLIILTAVWFMVNSVKNSLREAINPLQQANGELGTQVANLLHPTPTVIPDPVTIIHEVQAVSRLETIHYTVEKVITAEVNQGLLGPLFGDKLLFVGHGYVIAGIDMSKMNEADLWLEGEILNVRLPKAEVFVATLDNDQSYVYDRDLGILANPDPNLETIARQVAEDEILTAALKDGILDQARINAEVYLSKFFNALGYKSVVFSQQP
jgi:hypothetical protein